MRFTRSQEHVESHDSTHDTVHEESKKFVCQLTDPAEAKKYETSRSSIVKSSDNKIIPPSSKESTETRQSNTVSSDKIRPEISDTAVSQDQLTETNVSLTPGPSVSTNQKKAKERHLPKTSSVKPLVIAETPTAKRKSSVDKEKISDQFQEFHMWLPE